MIHKALKTNSGQPFGSVVMLLFVIGALFLNAQLMASEHQLDHYFHDQTDVCDLYKAVEGNKLLADLPILQLLLSKPDTLHSLIGVGNTSVISRQYLSRAPPR